MPIHISATELLLGVGDFLTIYLFGYMQRIFFEKKNWTKGKAWLVPMIYLLDWCMIFIANLQEIPPLNLLSMITAYMLPLFLIYQSFPLLLFLNLVFAFFRMDHQRILEMFFVPLSSVSLHHLPFETYNYQFSFR